MKQLTGLENLYLHLDSGAAPMHASSLAIYDRRTAPSGNVGFHDIQRFFADRAHRSGVFRRRLVALPFSMTRPYWIDDAGFDLEFHLRHIALPKPGDWRQLCAQVARLHARPLDRKRPLWECYVIEELDNIPGLPPGSFAVFLKTHCAAQGATLSAQLFAALHELAPDSRSSPAKQPPYFDRAPTMIDLLSRTVIDSMKWPLGLTRYAAGQVRPLLALGTHQAAALARRIAGRGNGQPMTKAPAPRTRFNGRVSPHRVVDGVAFDLADVERIRDRVDGATVNDVAITIIAGALRKYLDDCLEPPATSLVAEAPIASRSETRIYGTRAFADSAIMALHTDVEDPAQRLRLIVADVHRHRARARRTSVRWLMQDIMELLPAVALGLAGDAAQRVRLGGLLSPIVNTTIASIRGPDVPLYMAGASLVGYYGFAAVHDLAGLSHTVCYYNGAMTISIAACRGMLPDPAHYADSLRGAYAELGAALGVPIADSVPQATKVADAQRPAGRRARPTPDTARRSAAAR